MEHVRLVVNEDLMDLIQVIRVYRGESSCYAARIRLVFLSTFKTRENVI